MNAADTDLKYQTIKTRIRDQHVAAAAKNEQVELAALCKINRGDDVAFVLSVNKISCRAADADRRHFRQ